MEVREEELGTVRGSGFWEKELMELGFEVCLGRDISRYYPRELGTAYVNKESKIREGRVALQSYHPRAQ